MTDELRSESLFPLLQCWREPLASCATALRQVVRNRELQGADLLRVARLINAIENLPVPSQVGLIEASLGAAHSTGRSWQSIAVADDRLELGYGESSYEPQGTETSLHSVLEVELGVGTNRDGEDPSTVMIELEDWVSRFRSRASDPDTTFRISDEDVYPEDADRAWEVLPDGV